MHKIAALILLSASLAACSPPPPPPQYKDPLAGIMPVSAAAFPVAAPVAVQQPAGLIVSDNSEAYLEYEKAMDATARSYGSFTNQTAVRDMDPKSVVGRIVGLLRARYPDVALLNDMNGAERLGKKTVFVVDVQAFYGRYSGQSTKVDLTIFVFDPQRKPVSAVSGHGEATIPYPATDFRVQAAADQALKELDRKMTSAFH